MRKRLLGLFLMGLILFFSGGIIVTWGTPRLVEVSPPEDAVDVLPGAPLRLTFSRPMQAGPVDQFLKTVPPRTGQSTWQGSTLTFTPDQPWPSGQKVQVLLSPGAPAAGLLSFPTRQEYTWSFTIGNPLVAYLYPADGPADLYTIDPKTGETRLLTQGLGDVLDFSVASGGSAIFFSASPEEQASAIYRWDRATGESSLLLDCPQALCRSVQISPDGSLLAYERVEFSTGGSGEESRVWLLSLQPAGEAEAEAAARPFQASEADHEARQPRWSPEGLLTYYDADLLAFVIQNPESDEMIRLPSQAGLPGSWDPGGVSYVIPEIFAVPFSSSDSNLQPISSSHLLRFDRRDGSSEDLTGSEDVDDTSPVFSPRTGILAFARRYLDLARWTPGRQLWIMRPGEREAEPLTNEPFYNHHDFAWNSDESQLAYVRFDENFPTFPPEIWTIDADGTNAQQLVIGGYAPQWIP